MRYSYCILFISIIVVYIDSTDCAAAIGSKCVHIDYRGKSLNPKKKTCTQNSVCNKEFKLSVVAMPPYSFYPINTVVEQCCGSCTKFSEVKHYANITEVTPASLSESDFSILFLTSSASTSLYGHHFIPVIYAPSIYYITPKDEPIIKRLVTSCLNLYPLIIICLLLAVIAGFVAWLMETWNNEDEFPREFLCGWFEGFWWGFVSMTTVGYGDKCPKSKCARVFSIIWILIGVAMFGIFTAMLTTEIMKANNPKKPTISGSRVGVLKFREYDASIVAKEGGAVLESKGFDFESDLLELITMLKNKQVDGIVLDKYTLRLSTGMLQNETKFPNNDVVKFFLDGTARTKKFTGKEFSYGILVKNSDDYEYFRNAITDNRLPLETSIALAYNKKPGKEPNDLLFSPEGPHFIASLRVIGGIIGVVCCFGFVFEMWRRYGKSAGSAEHHPLACKTFQGEKDLV